MYRTTSKMSYYTQRNQLAHSLTNAPAPQTETKTAFQRVLNTMETPALKKTQTAAAEPMDATTPQQHAQEPKAPDAPIKRKLPEEEITEHPAPKKLVFTDDPPPVDIEPTNDQQDLKPISFWVGKPKPKKENIDYETIFNTHFREEFERSNPKCQNIPFNDLIYEYGKLLPLEQIRELFEKKKKQEYMNLKNWAFANHEETNNNQAVQPTINQQQAAVQLPKPIPVPETIPPPMVTKLPVPVIAQAPIVEPAPIVAPTLAKPQAAEPAYVLNMGFSQLCTQASMAIDLMHSDPLSKSYLIEMLRLAQVCETKDKVFFLHCFLMGIEHFCTQDLAKYLRMLMV